MRIVLSNASGACWGTVEVTRTLAMGLKRRGYDVTIFCRHVPAVHARLRGIAECRPILGGIDANPVTVARCLRALGALRPDLVVAQSEKDVRTTGLAARLRDIPVVMREETDRSLGATRRHRWFSTIPGHWVANSAATIRSIRASAPWIDPSRICLIPNAVDPAPHESATAAPLPVPGGAITFGYIGRFEERKGVFDLASAWRWVSGAVPLSHLVIAGAQGDRDDAFRRALGGEERVHWLGYRTDVPAVLKAIDVLVFPSFREGFGLVLAEAMLSGRPVVACRASNIPEIVTHDVEGLLVDPQAPAQLAGAMIALARDPEARRRMGHAGRERMLRDFSVDRMLDGHEALFARVLESGRHERSQRDSPAAAEAHQ